MKKSNIFLIAIFALMLTNCIGNQAPPTPTTPTLTPSATSPSTTPTPTPTATSTATTIPFPTHTPTPALTINPTAAPTLRNPAEIITIDSVARLEVLRTFKLDYSRYGPAIKSLSFSKDGSLFGIVPIEGKIKLWNVSTSEEIDTSMTVESTSSMQLFSRSENQILALKNIKEKVEIRDLTTEELFFSFTGILFPVKPAISNHSSLMAVASTGWPIYQNIVIWDLSILEPIQILYGDWASPQGMTGPGFVSFSPDDSLLIADVSPDRIIVWSTDTWERITELETERALAFSPDGTILAAREETFNIAFFDTSTWEKVKVIEDVSTGIESAEFSVDGKLLIVCARNGDIAFWDWQTEIELRILPTSSNVKTVLSPDGTLLASHSTNDDEIYIWGIP